MAKTEPSDHGRILGVEFARLADAMAPLHPEIPERCKTCAFRDGTVPNGYVPTLVHAMHCFIGTDSSPFGCHHTIKDGEPEALCSGYLLAKLVPFDDVMAALGRALVNIDALKVSDA